MQPKSRDELINTPEGWVPIGDIRVGDHLIGADGKPTKVLGIFPEQESNPTISSSQGKRRRQRRKCLS